MDNFEQYLRDNKEEFQLKEINPVIWEGILKDKPSNRIRPRWQTYVRWPSVAAVITLALGWNFLAPIQPSSHLSADLLEEYGFDQPFPAKLVDNKIAELKAIPIPKGYDEAYSFILQEIKEFDGRNIAIIEELERASHEEFTQRQALRYYRKKVDLLHQLIEDLQKIHQNEKAYPKATATKSSI